MAVAAEGHAVLVEQLAVAAAYLVAASALIWLLEAARRLLARKWHLDGQCYGQTCRENHENAPVKQTESNPKQDSGLPLKQKIRRRSGEESSQSTATLQDAWTQKERRSDARVLDVVETKSALKSMAKSRVESILERISKLTETKVVSALSLSLLPSESASAEPSRQVSSSKPSSSSAFSSGPLRDSSSSLVSSLSNSLLQSPSASKARKHGDQNRLTSQRHNPFCILLEYLEPQEIANVYHASPLLWRDLVERVEPVTESVSNLGELSSSKLLARAGTRRTRALASGDSAFDELLRTLGEEDFLKGISEKDTGKIFDAALKLADARMSPAYMRNVLKVLEAHLSKTKLQSSREQTCDLLLEHRYPEDAEMFMREMVAEHACQFSPRLCRRIVTTHLEEDYKARNTEANGTKQLQRTQGFHHTNALYTDISVNERNERMQFAHRLQQLVEYCVTFATGFEFYGEPGGLSLGALLEAEHRVCSVMCANQSMSSKKKFGKESVSNTDSSGETFQQVRDRKSRRKPTPLITSAADVADFTDSKDPEQKWSTATSGNKKQTKQFFSSAQKRHGRSHRADSSHSKGENGPRRRVLTDQYPSRHAGAGRHQHTVATGQNNENGECKLNTPRSRCHSEEQCRSYPHSQKCVNHHKSVPSPRHFAGTPGKSTKNPSAPSLYRSSNFPPPSPTTRTSSNASSGHFNSHKSGHFPRSSTTPRNSSSNNHKKPRGQQSPTNLTLGAASPLSGFHGSPSPRQVSKQGGHRGNKHRNNANSGITVASSGSRSPTPLLESATSSPDRLSYNEFYFDSQNLQDYHHNSDGRNMQQHHFQPLQAGSTFASSEVNSKGEYLGSRSSSTSSPLGFASTLHHQEGNRRSMGSCSTSSTASSETTSSRPSLEPIANPWCTSYSGFETSPFTSLTSSPSTASTVSSKDLGVYDPHRNHVLPQQQQQGGVKEVSSTLTSVFQASNTRSQDQEELLPSLRTQSMGQEFVLSRQGSMPLDINVSVDLSFLDDQ